MLQSLSVSACPPRVNHGSKSRSDAPYSGGVVSDGPFCVWPRVYGQRGDNIWDQWLVRRAGGRADYQWFGYEHKRAGEEIAAMFNAVAAPLMSRTHRSGSAGRSELQGEQLERFVDARARYKRWADEMSRHVKVTGNPVLAIILDLAVDGRSMREAERAHRVRNGKGLDLVRYGLTQYVAFAGWAGHDA